MHEPSPSRARRAALRARRRRRVALAGALVLLGVVAGVAVAASVEGTAPRSRFRHLVARRLTPVQARAQPSSSRAPSERDALRHVRPLVALGLPIYCGGPRGNELAFTFDDGPGPYTYLALRKLRQAGERATFFDVGRSMANFPGWVERETALATIGDHTYQHLVLPELPPAAITYQITQTRQAAERASGQPVRFFRPPYGARNTVVDGIAKRLGLLEILWSVDSADSLGANWAGIIRNVEAGMHPGAIILMHENRGQTIRALTTLLPELHRRHLRSVGLLELFASDPPSVAQVKRGERGCSGAPSGSVRTGS